MKKFKTLSEPMKIAYIGAVGAIIAAIVGAIIGGIFLIIHTSPTPTPAPTATVAHVPSPTATSPASVTSTITATPTPTPVLNRPGTPFLVDSMTGPNNQDQWDVLNQPYATSTYSNEGYDFKVPSNTVGGCNTEASTTILTNFIYEIKMTIVSGVMNDTFGTRGAGIMFRYDNQNPPSNYGISFQQDGTYFMFAYNKGNLGATLGAGYCTSFHQGTNQTNLIDIEAQGNTITLFVNNAYVMTATDNQFQSGQLGVQMGTGTTPAEVVYSDLKVWKL